MKEVKAEAAQSQKQKKKKKRKRRSKHEDDDDDSDDEDWKPSAGLKPKKRQVVEQGRFTTRTCTRQKCLTSQRESPRNWDERRRGREPGGRR